MKTILARISAVLFPPPSDTVEEIIDEIGRMLEALAVYDAVQKGKSDTLFDEIERLSTEREAVSTAARRAANLRRMLDKVYDGE